MGKSAHYQKSEVRLGDGIPRQKRHQSTKYLCDISHWSLRCQPGEERAKIGCDFILAAADEQKSTPAKGPSAANQGPDLPQRKAEGPGHSLAFEPN